jgi:hypothetical protein
MDRMEKKKRRKPEIGFCDVIKVVPVEPVMQRIEVVPLSTVEQTKSKEEPTEPKEEPTVPVVKKKRNSCFLC